MQNPNCENLVGLRSTISEFRFDLNSYIPRDALFPPKHTIPLLNNFRKRIDRDSPNSSNRRSVLRKKKHKNKQQLDRLAEIYSVREIVECSPNILGGKSMRLASGQNGATVTMPFNFYHARFSESSLFARAVYHCCKPRCKI